MGFIRVGCSLQRKGVIMCDVCGNIDRFCGTFIVCDILFICIHTYGYVYKM